MEFLQDFWFGIGAAFEIALRWGTKSVGNYLISGTCTRTGWFLLRRFVKWILDEPNFPHPHNWRHVIAQEGFRLAAVCALWPCLLAFIALIALFGVPLAFLMASLILAARALEAAGITDQKK